MKLFQSSPRIKSGAAAASRAITKWFPTPTLLYPHAAGIDISDASVKWLLLAPQGKVLSWGEEPLAPGIVTNGTIHDVGALSEVLRKVRKNLHGIRYAHAALPEEAAYVFDTHVLAGTDYEQALRMIEFEFEGRVPIPPAAAVYDFDVITEHHDGAGEEIGVAVFPLDLARSYCDAFDAAGITLLSLELEASSIARAVTDHMRPDEITLVVDFGRERSGFALVKHGIPIFTSTVEVGGSIITRALVEKLQMSEADAEKFRNEQGLVPSTEKSAGVEAAAGAAAALADEVARHYHYWDTRRDEHGERMTPVGKIILVGGSSNLRGLADYIAGRVQAPVEVGDIWQNLISYDAYIPPIDKRRSLQYATAAGLALRSIL